MKVAVFPDSAMIIINQINKSKHEVLSNYDKLYHEDKEKLSKKGQDYENNINSNIENLNLIKGIKYTGIEAPSAVQGRMSIFGPIIEEAEAAIILRNGKNHLYNELNELILFGSNGCNNTLNIIIYLLREKNIPILELKYPETRNDIINLIGEINNFLDYLTEYELNRTNKKYIKKYRLENEENKEDYKDVNKIIRDSLNLNFKFI